MKKDITTKLDEAVLMQIRKLKLSIACEQRWKKKATTHLDELMRSLHTDTQQAVNMKLTMWAGDIDSEGSRMRRMARADGLRDPLARMKAKLPAPVTSYGIALATEAVRGYIAASEEALEEMEIQLSLLTK